METKKKVLEQNLVGLQSNMLNFALSLTTNKEEPRILLKRQHSRH